MVNPALEGTAQPAVTVVCVDDHAGFRDAIRQVIAATPGFVLVGEAPSGTQALSLVPELRPDMVLIDVHMPGMSGIEAAIVLAGARRDLLVILMSAVPVRLPATLPHRGGEIVPVGKRELTPRRLLDLWYGRRTRLDV